MLLTVTARRSAVFFALALSGCGARTGLHGALVDAGTDAGDDAADAAPETGPDCVTDADCPTADKCSTRTCVEGTCQAPVPVVCDDKDPCTADSCVPDTGKCQFKPLTLDQDGDGYKGPRPGYAPGAPGSCGNDCNDANPNAHPGGVEVCDGVDNDCNGIIDDNMTYVPAGGGDVEISGNHKQAGIGGAAWDGTHYVATYSGQEAHWRDFAKGLNPDGSTAFDETPITDVNNDSYSGPIVWTGAMFGTAWEDRRNGNYEIYFNRLDSKGKKLAADLRVTDAGNFSLHPDVLWNGVEFIVVWDDRRNGDAAIFGQRIDVDGKLVGGNVPVSPTGPSAESPRIAEGVKTLGVVYNTNELLGTGVRFRLLGPDLSTSTGDVVLDDQDATNPVVIFNGDRYVAAWSRRTTVPGDRIWAATFHEDGTIVKAATAVTSGATFARSQSLLALGNRLILVWADDHDGNYELYSKMLNPDLTDLSPRARITNDPADSVDPVAVFGPGGDIGVAFDDTRTGEWQSYFTRLLCKAGAK